MLKYEYLMLNCETIDGRNYCLMMNKNLSYSKKEKNYIQFLIVKKYNGIESVIKIKEFKCNFLTNKVVRSKKQMMRKEFYQYIDGLKETKKK